MCVTKGDRERKKRERELIPYLGLGISSRKVSMNCSSIDLHSIDKCHSVRKLHRKGMEQALYWNMFQCGFYFLPPNYGKLDTKMHKVWHSQISPQTN